MYHIFTNGSYKKNSQEYKDIFLADNGPSYSSRITSVARIIIAPPTEDWRESTYAIVVHTQQRWKHH